MTTGDDPPGDPLGGGGPLARVDRPRSLTAIVTDQIRDLIITGKLALGEALSEGMVSDRLGVSRAPVRAAFALLQSERLLEVRPQRGTFVFQYDTTELRDICELRDVLETGALRIAIARDRDRLVTELRRLVRLADVAAPPDAVAYQPFDTAFHNAILLAADNAELLEAYIKISGRIRAIRYRLTQTAEQLRASQTQHGDVVDFIESGQDDAATALLSHHMYSVYRLFIEAASATPKQPALAEAS